MATSGISAYGTLIKIFNGASPETFTTIAEVVNISGPGLSMDTLDMTSHSSSSAAREFIGGLLDSGEISLDINYLPTDNTQDSTAGLIRDWKNRTVRNFQMIFPNASSTTYAFAALVTHFEPSAPVDGKLGASVTLKLTGIPTFTNE